MDRIVKFHKDRRILAMDMREKLLDKYRGCLVGGAVGDALGYPVEFMTLEEIVEEFGSEGIANYQLEQGLARISDDTQMSMFTAAGLLTAEAGFIHSEEDYISALRDSYEDWFRTQLYGYEDMAGNGYNGHSWLMKVPVLYERRAPGSTCLKAISEGCRGSLERSINDSKGCGGVMRIAPIGLFFGDYNRSLELAAKVSALTHGHSMSHLASGCLGHIIAQCVDEKCNLTLREIVRRAIIATVKRFDQDPYIYDFVELMVKAVKLSECGVDDKLALRELGEGWVAEETLAIAIYCALKYRYDFAKGIIVAVNHDGDSDSTGAVTGNILGAYLGLKNIPKKFLDKLELKAELISLAEDLFYGEPYEGDVEEMQLWKEKYALHI